MATTSSNPEGPYYGYACPASHTPLTVLDDAHLQSTTTGQVFESQASVPNFLSGTAIETEEQRQELLRLAELAKTAGCQAALEQVDPDSYHYVSDTSRARYLDLLPLTRDSRILEIGASRGQHSQLIAARCGHLNCVEVVAGQAQFGQLWCNEQGHSNVNFAVGGDDCRLPYLTGLFDGVILNYVFEWCGGRAEDDPASAQRRLLGECARVLKPGGWFFLSTKNRYSARLLMGAPDEHVGFRFGNALPRSMMNACLRMQGRSKPNGLLHSFRHLKGLLGQAGFDRIDSYFAVPDARYPLAYVPHDAAAIAAARGNTELLASSRLSSWLLRYGSVRVIQNFAPSHVFLSHRAGAVAQP